MIDREPRAGPWVQDTWPGQPLSFELCHQVPRNGRPLAALPKRAKPELADHVPERAQGCAVGRHGVIGEVAAHDAPKPGALFRNGSMEAAAQLLLDRGELGAHAIASRLPSKLEGATPGLPADMREPED